MILKNINDDFPSFSVVGNETGKPTTGRFLRAPKSSVNVLCSGA